MTFSRIIFLIVSYFLIITSVKDRNLVNVDIHQKKVVKYSVKDRFRREQPVAKIWRKTPRDKGETPPNKGTHFPGRQRRAHKGVWNYADNGPNVWGGLCQTGKRQSPINIKLGDSIVRNYPSFKFNEHYLRKHKFHAKNNGHTIYVSLQNDTIEPVIYGGGLPGSFIFEQLHMHWESEHEFDGKRTSMEMHMVHYNSKYGSFAEASKQPDGIAVLGVFFDESEDTDPLIENFFESILEDISEHKGHSLNPPPEVPSDHLQTLSDDDDDDDKHGSESHELFALRDLIPKKISKFFRYDGSLTTPGCDEVVQWTIFINRFPISRDVLDQMATIRDHDDHPILKNFRPPQNLNGREVYIQLKDHDEPESETGNLRNSGFRNEGLKKGFAVMLDESNQLTPVKRRSIKRK